MSAAEGSLEIPPTHLVVLKQAASVWTNRLSSQSCCPFQLAMDRSEEKLMPEPLVSDSTPPEAIWNWLRRQAAAT